MFERGEKTQVFEYAFENSYLSIDYLYWWPFIDHVQVTKIMHKLFSVPQVIYMNGDRLYKNKLMFTYIRIMYNYVFAHYTHIYMWSSYVMHCK